MLIQNLHDGGRKQARMQDLGEKRMFKPSIDTTNVCPKSRVRFS